MLEEPDDDSAPHQPPTLTELEEPRAGVVLGADPELFFPERGAGRPAVALAYCESCSVRSECLASALEVASTVGVWGGTSALGRRGLRRGVA